MKKTDIPAHWISAIFKKFQYRYGSKFLANIEGIEEGVVAEWQKGLAGFSGLDIKRGLEVWQEDWPPSLPEFKRACKEKRIACHEIYKALPVLKSDSDKAKKEIDKLKTILKTGQEG